MNLKYRLVKLERIKKPEMAPLVMIQSGTEWLPEQLQQIYDTKIQGRMVLEVVFVNGRESVNA